MPRSNHLLAMLSLYAYKAQKYFGALLLLAIPLYPKFPLVSVPGTYVSIRLEDFLLAGYLVIWILAHYNNLTSFLRLRPIQLFGLYVAISAISVAYASLITNTITPHIGLLHLLRRIEYFVPFLLGLSAVNDRETLWFYIKCITLVVFVSFVYALGQKYFSWPVITTQNFEYSKGVALRYTPGGHVNAGFAGHYDLASYMILIIPALLGISLTIRQRLIKIWLWMACLIAFWLLVSSASRISLLSYALAVVVALILVRKVKALILIGVISLIMSAFSTNLVSRYSEIVNVLIDKVIKSPVSLVLSPPTVYAQVSEIINTPIPTTTPVPVVEDRSTSIRLNVEWPRALRAFIKNPLLGTGFSSITLATDNEYLRALGETGLAGFISLVLVFVSLFGVLAKYLFTKANRSDILVYCFVVGFISSSLGILVSAVFIDIFEASKFAISYWFFAGIAWRYATNWHSKTNAS